MAKVTGVGGVFFKAKNPKALASWYQEHLGLNLQDFGCAILNWQEDKANDDGVTVWHVANYESDWFQPSSSPFMINYRIDNMEDMISQLKAANIEILKGPELHENGKFAWILDIEQNKIELWEPKKWEDFSP